MLPVLCSSAAEGYSKDLKDMCMREIIAILSCYLPVACLSSCRVTIVVEVATSFMAEGLLESQGLKLRQWHSRDVSLFLKMLVNEKTVTRTDIKAIIFKVVEDIVAYTCENSFW